MKKAKTLRDSITITLPDDWHHHFRDDARLGVITKLVSKQFGRAIAMPNLVPPVTTTLQAIAYRERILNSVKSEKEKLTNVVDPLMTLYLTDETQPEEILRAVSSGVVFACKLYPAGATTNSHAGVTDINKVLPVIEEMARLQMPLLVHGEVTDQHVDIFDREARYIETVLRPLLEKVPHLKLVMEHITTKDAVEFVESMPDNVAATITCHHLLYNRNAIFKNGLQPHFYCLPVLKRELHREALLRAATSGSPKFFLGTDSAAHEKKEKEKSCGCAGCFTAHAALEMYAEAFDQVDALDKLQAFASENGPRFYGLKPNTKTITLVRKPWKIPDVYEMDDGKGVIVPLRAGEEMEWKVEDITN